MALLEINIIPVGTDSASFSSHVGHALNVLNSKGLKYQVTPTATVIEGELDMLLETAKEIHRTALERGATRVITNMTLDDRTDKPLSMEEAVKSAQQSIH